MALDDSSESPVFQVPYNTTNATKTLTINVTEAIVSVGVAYDQRRNVQGLRLYGFNNTLLHEDYFAQIDSEWSDTQSIPDGSRIFGFEA